MSNELVTQHTSKLSVWDSVPLEEIKANCAPLLSNSEFKYFVEMGKACDLNPFLREIWSIKYDQKVPAQVFIARDGYRKAAQRHPDYDFHYVDSVWSNDVFKVINGEVTHEYTLKDRGKLVGAYCFVKRKNSSRPMYVYVDLTEYNTGKSNWAKMPSTMIKKVAESQCLRAAFQELFAGTHDEAEHETAQYIRDGKHAKDVLQEALLKNSNGATHVNKDNKQSNHDADTSIIESEPMESQAQTIKNEGSSAVEQAREKEAYDYESNNKNYITDQSIELIHQIIHERQIPASRVQNGLKSFGVLTIEELSEENAQKMIKIFSKQAN